MDDDQFDRDTINETHFAMHCPRCNHPLPERGVPPRCPMCRTRLPNDPEPNPLGVALCLTVALAAVAFGIYLLTCLS